MNFREETLNFKGLRPIPIVLHGGKTIDWNMLSRPEKQILKKNLKKKNPRIWAKIEASKKIKIYAEPIAENVYFCDQCNKTHVAHEIDRGKVPAFVACHNCKWPEARSLGYEIPESYKKKSPNIVFRYPTEKEYEAAQEDLKVYLESGGLFIEIIK